MRLFLASWVRPGLALALVAAIASCDDGTRPVATNSGGVAVTGQVAWLPVPQSEPRKAFAPLAVQFKSRDGLLAAAAGGGNLATDGNAANANLATAANANAAEDANAATNADATEGASAAGSLSAVLPLPGAAAGCAAEGCPFQVSPVTVRNTADAVFAEITSSGAATEELYVPTTTMVLNNNQLLVASRSSTSVATQGQALVVSRTGLAQLGKLAGLSADALLARGACIGLVASSRDFSAGPVPGLAGALVTLADAPAGAEVVYVDDAWLAAGRSGTNKSGAFLAVGPKEPAAGGAGSAIVAHVQAPGGGLAWPNQHVITKPGTVTVVPLLPTP